MRLVVLDRDGVINHDSDQYIRCPEQWEPIPGSLEAIAHLCRAEYRVVVVTNQSGVGRGLFTMDTLSKIHTRMLEHVRQKGGQIDAIFICPCRPEDNCLCRKPKPGMLHDLAARLKVSLAAVPMVGDAARDLQAARAVGGLPVLVRTGKGQAVAERLARGEVADVGSPVVFDDLAAFTDDLLHGELDEAMDALLHPA